jgi:Mg2+ and Co2+ transporter CorA
MAYLLDSFSAKNGHGLERYSHPFHLLVPVYKIIASEWLVVISYSSRELSTIEWKMEKRNASFSSLEVCLQDLFVLRRRCTLYTDLICCAQAQIIELGKASWGPQNTKVISSASSSACDLTLDFKTLQHKMEALVERVQNNISTITALVALGESKHSLEESHNVKRLTVLATIFLPFSTIASIMGMQGTFGVGSHLFWVYWVTALGIVVGLLLWIKGMQLWDVRKATWKSKSEARTRVVPEMKSSQP